MSDIKIKDKYPEIYDGFVGIPRKILNDYYNGLINKSEYFVLLYIFHISNPYGLCFVANSDIAFYVLNNQNNGDYAGKIMRSLKDKKFLFFKNNQGNRSKYEVKPAYFLLSTQNFTTPESICAGTDSEVAPHCSKSVPLGNAETTIKNTVTPDTTFRDNNNENEIDIYTEINNESEKERVRERKLSTMEELKKEIKGKLFTPRV